MNLSCTSILDFDQHAVILPLQQYPSKNSPGMDACSNKNKQKPTCTFLNQKEAQNFFRPLHGLSQVRMQPLDANCPQSGQSSGLSPGLPPGFYLLGYPLHQVSRKLLCLLWNGDRGGRNSNCAIALQVLLDIKNP